MVVSNNRCPTTLFRSCFEFGESITSQGEPEFEYDVHAFDGVVKHPEKPENREVTRRGLLYSQTFLHNDVMNLALRHLVTKVYANSALNTKTVSSLLLSEKLAVIQVLYC